MWAGSRCAGVPSWYPFHGSCGGCCDGGGETIKKLIQVKRGEEPSRQPQQQNNGSEELCSPDSPAVEFRQGEVGSFFFFPAKDHVDICVTICGPSKCIKLEIQPARFMEVRASCVISRGLRGSLPTPMEMEICVMQELHVCGFSIHKSTHPQSEMFRRCWICLFVCRWSLSSFFKVTPAFI